MRDRRQSLAAEWAAYIALAREWAPVVDARWTSTGRSSAMSESDRGLQRRKRAIDDLTTEWIAAKRLPARAETAFRCGIP